MEILWRIRNSDRGGEDRPKKGRGEGCHRSDLPGGSGLRPGPVLGPGPVLDVHLVQRPALFPDVERTKPGPVELVPHLCNPSRGPLRHVHLVPRRAVRVAHRSRGVFGELEVKEPGNGCSHQGGPGPSLGRDPVEPGSGYRDLVRLVLDRTGARTALVPVPFLVWDGLACGMALLPNPTLTHDQVKRMKRDYVVGREALELGDLGIRPILLEEALPDCIPDW